MAEPDSDAAGEVELHRRTSADEADKLFRILFAAVQLGAPASKRQIAEQAGLSSQLVDYHVPKLVASRQLLLQAGRYRPQACLTDKNLFRLMKSSLIRQQLIRQRLVLLLGLSAPPGARNRAHLHDAVLHPHQQF